MMPSSKIIKQLAKVAKSATKADEVAQTVKIAEEAEAFGQSVSKNINADAKAMLAEHNAVRPEVATKKTDPDFYEDDGWEEGWPIAQQIEAKKAKLNQDIIDADSLEDYDAANLAYEEFQQGLLEDDIMDILESSSFQKMMEGEDVAEKPLTKRQQMRALMQDPDFEIQRVEHLFNPKAEALQGYQTKTPEEFSRRYHDQLSNSEYQTRAGMGVDGSMPMSKDQKVILMEMTTDLDMRKLDDSIFQWKTTRAIRGSKRKEQWIDNWLGDSPYRLKNDRGRGRILNHIERQSNPFQEKVEDLIQFQGDPYEGGVHSGTNAASIRATLRNVDGAKLQMDEFNDWVDELVAQGDSTAIPHTREQINTTIANGIEDFFINKFRTIDDGKVTNEVLWAGFEEELLPVFKEFGSEAPVQHLSAFIATIKQLPLANSTPHYFRGKHGLVMEDKGGWYRDEMVEQLLELFPDVPKTELNALREWPDIHVFLEGQGYDHIIYNNTVEDIGSTSIINWNPDLMLSVYDPRIGKRDMDHNAKIVAGMVIAAFGIQLPGQPEGG